MSDHSIDCGDCMGLIDRVSYAFNSVMSIRAEMIAQEDQVDERIKSFCQDVISLKKK